MSYGEVIKFEIEGNVGILVLDNEKKMNVVGEAFFNELGEIQQEILKDKTLRASAIVANGDHFSAGIDLKFLKTASSEKIKEGLQGLQDLYSFWQTLPIPVVIGVQGYCIGSAVELMVGCDLRIASDDAMIYLPEVKLGLSPDMGGTTRLTKLVGIGQAKRMIMTCEEVDAQEALRIGLVEKVVPALELREYTIKLVKKMSYYPPSSIRFSKMGINLAQESSVSAGLLFEQAQSTYCCGTEDMKEAIGAFFEKRRAVFKDK